MGSSGGSYTWTDTTSVNGGKLILGQSLTTTSAINADRGTFELVASGSKVVRATSVTASGGKIDLKDNKLVTAVPTGFSGGNDTGIALLVKTARGVV